MNAINKVGRPIIPSRSSDESFSSGRARERAAQGRRRKSRGWRRRRRRGKAETRGAGGWTGRAFGQFVIKLKIPSAEEADERVTNGRDRNGSSTGRRHVTTDKRREPGVYPASRLHRAGAAARYLTSTLSLSLSLSMLSLPSPLVHDHPRNAGFPWGTVGADGGRRVKSSCEQFSIAPRLH